MELNRRKALILGAAGFGLAGAGQALAQAAAPAPAADAAAAAPAEPAAVKTVDEWIAEFTGGKEPGTEGIRLTAPEIAENGNTVPVSVEAEGATEILMLATGNPTPGVMVASFGPAAGKHALATRIRLAKTQDVVAIAKLADGNFAQAKSNVKVTIGGCGG
ncbi:thiosulfate oxidation carrier protein SoxY [Paracoccus panacisoli]|uniref:Sulfur-oxidizing protein SoxY n=2 Tax=Paracoccus TaxID=265 RepID=A0A1H2TR48_9RHOB|nr:thiosulfate oxidation carrier protein SoxY [Paracoccus sanguinis]QJD17134.1 thiosulfate oxidation carrier protein SoxY [Paracoccus sanguinis]SDW46247.1 sulfur-oxidizing protein SoxY [Paracoccus sanguinis]